MKEFFKRITLLFKALPKTIVILFCLVVVGMNLLSQIQLVSLPFLAINAGICVSWLAFLVLDVITKHFGAKAANYLSILAITVNIAVGFIFFILSLIFDNPNFDIFVFAQWSILLASTIAFVISALTNNYVNVFIGKKIKTNPDGRVAFTIRSLISTFLGQIVDNFLFVFLAFYLLPLIPQATPVHWTIWQCLGCSILGALIELGSEIIFTPIGYRIVRYWKKHNVGEEYIKSTYELHKYSASEIGELVNKRIFRPIEVVKYFENRINKYNKKVNAFTYTKFKEAEEAAIKLESRIANGEYVGPFAGVPFALKDFLDSKKGWTNSIGGIRSFDRVDQSDSLFCIAMESLGGIAIGKCNAPTYAFRGTCDNFRYGPTSTPYNKKYNSGGSSGGSAAAVGMGLVPIAEGGDAGGSIRIPASWCGVIGFKASNGTVPNVLPDYLDTNAFPFCMGGGLTNSIKDSAILLSAMQQYDSRDPNSQNKPKVDYLSYINKPIKDLKVGYTDGFDIFEVDKQIKDKVYKKAMSLTKLGAKVEKVHFDIPYSNNELSNLWLIAVAQESSYECKEYLAEGIDFTNDLPKEIIEWNKKAIEEKDKLKDYIKAKKQIKAAFDRVFSEYDVIISPTSCCLPIKNSNDGNTKGPEYINNKKTDSLIGFATTYLINFIGNPAISIPAGFGKHHLPIGLQIVGKYLDDESVIKVASKLTDK